MGNDAASRLRPCRNRQRKRPLSVRSTKRHSLPRNQANAGAIGTLAALLGRGRPSTNHIHVVDRFIRFCVVGATGVLVDTAILFLLADDATLAMPLLFSKLIAAEIAMVNNFYWNDRVTFGDFQDHQSGLRSWIGRFLRFNLFCSFGLVINVSILNLLTFGLGFNRYIANLIAIVTATAWNFGMNYRFNWGRL